MSNELNENLGQETITVSSLEKLDGGYIRIVGQKGYNDIDVITNGIFTFDFSPYVRIDKIISFDNKDYAIVIDYFGNQFLICINDNIAIVSRTRNIRYLEDGLFEIVLEDKSSEDTTKKIFDLTVNKYIDFPSNMILNDYKVGILVLEAKDDSNKKMAIDRTGEAIIPLVEGNIRIISDSKFVIHGHKTNDSIIDFNGKVIVQEANLIMPLSDNQIMILKNQNIYILDDKFEIVRTYKINMTSDPWYTCINKSGCIVMAFEKNDGKRKSGSLADENDIIMINPNDDQIMVINYFPPISSSDISIVTGKQGFKGLIDEKMNIILDIEYEEIKALKDSKNRYFYVKKEGKYYIFDVETKRLAITFYTEMKTFRDGLAIGFSKENRYQLIDENLNVLFYLPHMGHFVFYYSDGILCYHSGNYYNNYDAYTIINQNGDIIMPQKECSVKRNGFGLLEVTDGSKKQTQLFDMKTGEFIKIELNVPLTRSKDKIIMDFNGAFIQSSIPKRLNAPLFSSQELSEDSRMRRITFDY